MVTPNALVTDVSGFIGSHLAEHLGQHGFRVVGTVAKPSAVPARLRRLNALTIQIADLLDRDDVRALFHAHEYDHIFHVAGELSDTKDLRRRDDVNTVGTENLINASLSQLVRSIVVVSSTAVYGRLKQLPATEYHAHNPITRFGRIKADQEDLALEFATEQRLPITLLRPAPIYGPRCNTMSVMSTFIHTADRITSIPGNGCVKMNHVHVDDVCGAARFLALQPAAIGQAFNIADDTPVPLDQLLWSIALYFNIEPPRLHLPRPIVGLMKGLWKRRAERSGMPSWIRDEILPYFYSDHHFSNQKIKELGYTLRWPDYRDGSRATVNWYCANNRIGHLKRVLPPSKLALYLKRYQQRFGEPLAI